jgi:hypothetical protein
VKRSATSGSGYVTIANGVAGTTYTDSGLTGGTTYYYVVSGVNSSGEGANSNQASVTTASGGLPSPWVSADVGKVATAGSATYNNGTFSILGSGANIAAKADEFQFVSQPATGDCSVVARVASIANTNSSAKAGVLIRETTAAGSRYAGVFITPGKGVMFQRRSSTGGSTASSSVSGVKAPKWIKITRTGSTLRAYYSSNGVSWTQFGGNRTVSMAASVSIGMGVCSRVDGTLCASSFDSVTASP